MSRFRFVWFKRRWGKWIALALVALGLPLVCLHFYSEHRQKLVRDVILQGSVVVVSEENVPDWTFQILGWVGRDWLFHVLYTHETVLYPEGKVIEPEAVLEVTDAVNRLGSIRAVRLREQKSVEPGVFEALRSWHTIERLYLTNSGITDESLTEIAKLSTLRELDLDHNPVTAEGLRPLAALPQLERLSLVGTNVRGSEVIPILKSMPALKEVRLGGRTPVSTEEKNTMKDALPGVTVTVYAEGDKVPTWK